MSTVQRSARENGGGVPDLRVGGAGLLASDARVVFLLVDEARCRVMGRLFGVSRDGPLLVTAIALGVAAGAVGHGVKQAVRLPKRPSGTGALLGGTVVRESLRGLAGAATSEAPMFGSLVAAAVAATSLRAGLRATTRSVRASSREVRTGFDHRYRRTLGPSRL